MPRTTLPVVVSKRASVSSQRLTSCTAGFVRSALFPTSLHTTSKASDTPIDPVSSPKFGTQRSTLKEDLNGIRTPPSALGRLKRHGLPLRVPVELLSPSAAGAGRTVLARPSQARGFLTSAIARGAEQDPNSFERRRQEIPTSSWSRPTRPSQDADDDTVPSYYVERKKQRESIAERKEEEGGLMYELNAGILSDEVAAQTRAREEKIPVEVRLPDGTVSHPSGFEPPTPETEFHPIAAKVPTEDNPLLATVKQSWDERDFAQSRPIAVDPEKEAEWIKRAVSSGNAHGKGGVTEVSNLRRDHPVLSSTSASTSASDDPDSVVPTFYLERKKQRDSIAGREEEEADLMHELNAGILSDEVAARTREREEKIPVEVLLDDGTIAHPSGFVPPTAETDFHPVASKPGDVPKQSWSEILESASKKF